MMRLHDALARAHRQTSSPRWVKWIQRFRADEDTGVGDTIERLLGKWGERFKKTMQRWNIDCGCSGRQRRFNRLYPYE